MSRPLILCRASRRQVGAAVACEHDLESQGTDTIPGAGCDAQASPSGPPSCDNRARDPPGPRRAAHRRARPAGGHCHGQSLRLPVPAAGQPGQRRPRAARRLRGRRRPRRRRPRAPSRRHRRRHRLRQAARPRPEGPGRASRYVRRRPRRRDPGVRRLHRHRRLRHGDAHPRRAHLLHHRRRGVPAAHHARTAGADDAGRNGAPARLQEEPALVRAHRQADRLRRQGTHVRAVRRARRHAARNRIAGRSRRDASPAPSWTGRAASGSSATAGSIRPSRTAAATRPGSAASWRCRGIRRSASSTRCSTGATISTGPGPATSPAGRARCCRPRSSSRSPTGSTAAGRTTTTTSWRGRRS